MNADLCSNINFLKPLKLVITAVDIIKIIVPVLLLVFCMIEIVKSLLGQEDVVNGIWKKISTKVIVALVVFLVPAIFSLLSSIISDASGRENCIQNARNLSTTVEIVNKV